VSRRAFLQQTSALCAFSLLGIPIESRAEPPPEISKIRLVHAPAICLAPQYLAEELLRLEGFTQIEYVPVGSNVDPVNTVASGQADISMDGVTGMLPLLDDERPIVILGGVHGGCYELFGNEQVNTIRDLKGKRVAIIGRSSGEYIYLASILAYVGMDPRKDIDWIATGDFNGPPQLFIDGKVDAFLGFPPQPQQVRARKVGHVIVNTAEDKPWSQHFCCMIAGHREFVRKQPVATKRAIRAILKATDICARQPELAAKYMVKKGYEGSYDIALEVVNEVSYNAWRLFNPEDTLRFHALRLREVGMIKSTPQTIIAQGTDWRFLNELKKELKA
jgi:NitT/TauT family transport system substrate-binding protein